MVEGLHLTSMKETTRPPELTIGEVAALTGLPVKRIHYYERRGLLEPPPRSAAGYRLYGTEEVARLEFVKRAKLLGLTLEEIRELVALATRCNEGQIVPRLEEVLDAKLEETEQKVAELSAFRENLLYYRRRAEELRKRLPVERTCEEASFCGCLEAVIEAEGDERDNQR
jgi:MerR family transcriptional regulator, copper efflux regulator